MICPVLSIGSTDEVCLGKECAWWDEISDGCSIRVIVGALWDISAVLEGGVDA